MTQVSLVIVDDHPLFREGVTVALSHLGFEVVEQGSTRDDAIRLTQQYRPDIILLDISMPGGGLEAIGPILAHNPHQKIVLLTVSESSEDATKAIQAGAKGYVLKGVGARTLAEVLKTIAQGELYVAPSMSAKMLVELKTLSSAAKIPLETLTAREREILELVAQGMSNKHIAIHLNLQEKTIKYHLTRIFSKLQVTNRTAAAMVLHNPRTMDLTA